MAAVAPGSGAPSLRHWKVGEPVAATVKVAVLPALTVWLAGWVVNVGSARAPAVRTML